MTVLIIPKCQASSLVLSYLHIPHTKEGRSGQKGFVQKRLAMLCSPPGYWK